MSHTRYFVTRAGARWIVTFDGTPLGRFPTRTEATEAAIVMADLMGAMHHDADVMVATAPGAPLEMAWSYGTGAAPRARQSFSVGTSGPHIRQVQQGVTA